MSGVRLVQSQDLFLFLCTAVHSSGTPCLASWATKYQKTSKSSCGCLGGSIQHHAPLCWGAGVTQWRQQQQHPARGILPSLRVQAAAEASSRSTHLAFGFSFLQELSGPTGRVIVNPVTRCLAARLESYVLGPHTKQGS